MLRWLTCHNTKKILSKRLPKKLFDAQNPMGFDPWMQPNSRRQIGGDAKDAKAWERGRWIGYGFFTLRIIGPCNGRVCTCMTQGCFGPQIWGIRILRGRVFYLRKMNGWEAVKMIPLGVWFFCLFPKIPFIEFSVETISWKVVPVSLPCWNDLRTEEAPMLSKWNHAKDRRMSNMISCHLKWWFQYTVVKVDGATPKRWLSEGSW